jgi:hypothetical protein
VRWRVKSETGGRCIRFGQFKLRAGRLSGSNREVAESRRADRVQLATILCSLKIIQAKTQTAEQSNKLRRMDMHVVDACLEGKA